MRHRRAFSLLLMLSLSLAACAKGASDSSSDPPGATQPDTWNNLSWNQDNWS